MKFTPYKRPSWKVTTFRVQEGKELGWRFYTPGLQSTVWTTEEGNVSEVNNVILVWPSIIERGGLKDKYFEPRSSVTYITFLYPIVYKRRPEAFNLTLFLTRKCGLNEVWHNGYLIEHSRVYFRLLPLVRFHLLVKT